MVKCLFLSTDVSRVYYPDVVETEPVASTAPNISSYFGQAPEDDPFGTIAAPSETDGSAAKGSHLQIWSDRLILHT